MCISGFFKCVGHCNFKK